MRHFWIPLAGIVLVLNQPMSGQTFMPRVSQTIHGNALWLAAGDFDGDGQTDVAVGNNTNNANEITTFYGDGSALVKRSTTTSGGGAFPSRLRAADLDRDGRSDLAFMDGVSVAVVHGQANRTFSSIQSFGTTSYNPGYIAIGDLNRDGLPDLAVTDVLVSQLKLFHQSSQGSFVAAPLIGAISGAEGIAVADLNHDGWTDIAMSSNSSGVSVLYGGAAGYTRQDFGAGLRPTELIAGDFNGDSLPDLTYAAFNGGAGVMLSSPIGGLTGPSFFSTAPGPCSIAMGDFDRDGRADLVLGAQNSNLITVLMGNGDGTFDRRMTLFGSYNGSSSVAVGDFDGNGWDDIAYAGASGNAVDFFYNVPEPAPITFCLGAAIGLSLSRRHRLQ